MPVISLFNIFHGSPFPSNITPAKGALWYDTSDNSLKIYNGTSWVVINTSGGGGGGGSSFNPSSITEVNQSNYNVNINNDLVLLISAASNNVTVNIPSATNGRLLYLKRTDNNNSNTVNINVIADGVNNFTMDPFEYKVLLFYGSKWHVIGS